MQNKQLCQKVHDLVLPKTQELGIDIWDIDFEKEGSIYCLNIYLDSEAEISIDHCEKVSRFIDPLLDDKQFDSLPSYTLCVSSAGLERKLIKPIHFEKNMQKLVNIGFYKAIDGQKSIEGILDGYENGNVTLNIDGEIKTFEKTVISSTRLVVEF